MIFEINLFIWFVATFFVALLVFFLPILEAAYLKTFKPIRQDDEPDDWD